MKIPDLLNMDCGACIDWLEKNQHDIVLVPRELTKPIRDAFHDSMYDFHEGNEVEGCPDDQWAAMIRVIEQT
jgi:hypothetical protein